MVLEWDRPLDTGGRSDLQYGVLCQKCSGEGPCEDCTASPGGSGAGKVGGGVSIGIGGIVERSGSAVVRFIPRQTGLMEPRVTVLNLVAHTNYSFRILATNAVTHLSNEASPCAIVNITTNQAGMVHTTSTLDVDGCLKTCYTLRMVWNSAVEKYLSPLYLSLYHHCIPKYLSPYRLLVFAVFVTPTCFR